MRTWARGTSRAAVLTASFVALGATTIPTSAFADVTNGDGSVLGGNQLNLPISAPVDVSGNGAAVGGTARSVSKGGSSVGNGGGGQQTSGKHGVGSGNQMNAPISLPVSACGNAAAVVGKTDTGCKGGSSVGNGGGGQTTSGEHGIGSGNQVNAPISAPVNACGNAIAIFGRADAGCKGGAKVAGGGRGGQVTSGASGVVAGNQLNAPISAPVNVCGNAAAIFGEAVAGCEGGAVVKNGGRSGARQTTSGISSVGGGNQANAPISAPVNVCGNAIGNAMTGCQGGASVRNGGHGSGGQTTNGDFSVLGGNQANAPISIPATVCGNAVALLGQAGAFCEGGAHVRSSSGGSQHTSGTSGVLAGNQANAPITVPVEVCGNAAAVLGAAAASCNGQTLVKGAHGSGARTSGQSSVGGGNQGNAPGEAPVGGCGNGAAVVGHAEPQCQGGEGGYHPYDRVRSTPLPGAEGLPSVAEAGKSLPLSPGAALPVLGKLPTAGQKARYGSVTGPAPGTDVLSGTGGLTGDLSDVLSGTGSQRTMQTRPQTNPLPAPNAPNAPATLNGLPQTEMLPETNALPGTGVLPRPESLTNTETLPASGILPKTKGLPKTNGLPKSKGLLKANSNTLPGVGQAPVDPATLTSVRRLPGVPSGAAVPASPIVPVASSARTYSRPLPGASVPGTGVPGVDGVRLPGLSAVPVTGDVKAPEVGGVTEQLDQAGAMKPVAAHSSITAQTKTGSMWVLGVAAMFAAVSGALALTRRIRLGGRR
ncbi:chaplin family protein [Actinomadura rubrisoli]|nr:chaplin family protein [Actinomadura rubrisoli]